MSSEKCNKRYCNGCIHSRWMAGISSALSAKLGIQAQSYPTHTCSVYSITRSRTKADMPKLKECTQQKFESERSE